MEHVIKQLKQFKVDAIYGKKKTITQQVEKEDIIKLLLRAKLY